MEKIRRTIEILLPSQPHLDHLAVGVVDFGKGSFEAINSHAGCWYDLASLTKILTNSTVEALHPKDFNSDMRLVLEHRGGLPAWGLLPHEGWRQQILGYPIKGSATLYSDFSALRTMLEYEKKTGRKMKDDSSAVWDKEICWWRDLPRHALLTKTGEREGGVIIGQVHDPNAWNIGEFCSHAGLFGTVEGVCRTMLALEKKTGVLKKVSAEMDKGHQHRFVFGWDRVENPDSTLAGKGCSKHTFGHLGFTGTSVWIDPDRGLGHVILSNATRDGWFLKEGLNEIRRAIGQLVWAG